MKYFNLNPHIFFIKGALKGTIYDSKKGDIYCLSEEATKIIHLLVEDAAPIKETYKIADGQQIVKFLNNIIDNELGYYCNNWVSQNLDNVKSTHFVSIVWYEVTSKCNLRCLHCYDKSSPKSLDESSLNMNQEINMLHNISTCCTHRIQFIGGEPFLQFGKLKHLIHEAKQIFKKIEIFTNGTLIYNRDDIFKFISDNNVTIALSLYSNIPDIHDGITTVSGSHHKTMTTITKLKKYKIPFRVATVLLKQNIHFINVTRKCLQSDYDVILRASPVILTGRASKHLVDSSVIKKKLITMNRFKQPYNFKKFSFNLNYHNCYGKKLYVANNGNVYPCVMDRRINLGSITKQTMEDILGSTAYKRCITMNKDSIDTCKDCEFRYYCHDCRPDAIYNQQSFLSKPWNCTYNPYTGQWSNTLANSRKEVAHVDN